ncbi:hypothetical protein PMIT1327_02394 [Prochlorococcus marinus str. MIT 1327]|nr:hypothetical protein PMIT1312_01203 [Prochlorococcus marinus str. MIT 1312]KZR79187.1 hypothetical protein PMIT1327_02394 [Prochlorococcus marinus str. MIT 1327]
MKAPIVFLITLPLLTAPVKAAQGYWLDQYNALILRRKVPESMQDLEVLYLLKSD